MQLRYLVNLSPRDGREKGRRQNKPAPFGSAGFHRMFCEIGMQVKHMWPELVLPFSSVSPLSGLHLSWLLRWAIAAEFLACSLTSESNAFTVSLILWELYAHVFLDKSWQLLTAERYTNKKVLNTDLTPNLPLAVICQAGHLWTSAK